MHINPPRRHGTYRNHPALLMLAALAVPVCISAQSLPPIGLSGEGALLLQEMAPDAGGTPGANGPMSDDLFGASVAADDFNGF